MRRLLTACSGMVALLLLVPLATGLAADLPGADHRKGSDSNASAASRDGVLIHFDAYPTPEQRSELEKLGVQLVPGSWIAPSESGHTGFMYAELPSGQQSAVGSLQSVEGLQDAGPIIIGERAEYYLGFQEVLHPYKHPRSVDDYLRLNAVREVRDQTQALAWAESRRLETRDDMVRVRIVSETDQPISEGFILDYGGVNDDVHDGVRVAWLPIDMIANVVQALGSDYRLDRPIRGWEDDVIGGHVVEIGADVYQDAGLEGAGITIAVIDGGYASYTNAQTNGDWPSGGDLDIINLADHDPDAMGSSDHGTACVEVIYDLAPDATYRVYHTDGIGDISTAVADGLANGVDIFSMSLSYYNTGWHDNTGAACAGANAASAGGALFFTSAGNRANRHWQGTFTSADGDDWHDFGPGPHEVNTVTLANGEWIDLHLQWNTDAGGTDDYDLFLYDASLSTVLASSEAGGETYEEIDWQNTTGGTIDVNFAVLRYSGSAVEFEVFSHNNDFDLTVPENSTTSPSNATGVNVISVAAVDVDDFGDANPSLQSYSSRGPTNDGNQAPRLTGTTNVATFTSGGSFGGTSCATPCCAGTAALALMDLGSIPTVRDFLFDEAFEWRDWGAGGYDFNYGWGGVILPPPGRIFGYVEHLGTGLSGVDVRLWSGDPPASVYGSATTDGSGLYEFNDLVPAAYTVEIMTPDGYVSLIDPQQGVDVPFSPDVQQDFDIGMVEFTDKTPLPGSTAPTWFPDCGVTVELTDGSLSLLDDGTIDFEVNGNDLDSLDLTGWPSGRVEGVPAACLGNQNHGLTFEISDAWGQNSFTTSWGFEVYNPYGYISGLVTLDGSGVPNVDVHVYTPSMTHIASTSTDGVGAYRFDHVLIPNGDYEVWIDVPPCMGPAGDTIVNVTVDGCPEAIANFELLEIYATSLTPSPGSTVDTCETTISAMLNVDGGTLADIDPASIVMTLNGGVVSHSYDPATGLVSYFTDPPLPNDDYTVTIDVADQNGYSACQTEWQFEILQPYGDIVGTVTDNGNAGAGLLGVPVALVNMTGDTLSKTVTEADGSFFFGHVMNGDYLVTIWQMPLGYVPEYSNTLSVTVFGWPPAEAHFPLNRDAAPPGCDGTSNFFWAWQVWGAIQNYQGLKYTRDEMICFREKIHAHFDPWIPHFHDVESLRDMFCTLFRFWSSTTREEALSHYYALLLNLASGRMNTYEIVSHDGATAAQAVLHISGLLETGDPDDTKLALGLARAVNWKWCILPAGWIPLSTPNIAFKNGGEISSLPTEFNLSQNYPNPFNPTTDIQLALPKASEVRLDIFNLLGQKVTTLVDGTLPAGYHTITWDATGHATGVYFYRLATDEFVTSRKMVLVK